MTIQAQDTDRMYTLNSLARSVRPALPYIRVLKAWRNGELEGTRVGSQVIVTASAARKWLDEYVNITLDKA